MTQHPTPPAETAPVDGTTLTTPDTLRRIEGEQADGFSPVNGDPLVTGSVAGDAIAAASAMKSKMWPAAGVAIGIGSAAVAAALLYRSRRP